MRILHLAPTPVPTSVIGGIESDLGELIPFLNGRGVETALLACVRTWKPPRAQKSFPLHTNYLVPSLWTYPNALMYRLGFPYFAYEVYRATKKLAYAALVPHDFDVIHAHGTLEAASINPERTYLLTSVNGTMADSGFKTYLANPKMPKFSPTVARSVLSYLRGLEADAVRASDGLIYHSLNEKIASEDSGKDLFHVPRAVPTGFFAQEAARFDARRPTIVYHGRFDAIKRLDVFLEIFSLVRKAIPGARARLIGGKPSKYVDLLAIIGKLGIPQGSVEIAPPAPFDRIPSALSRASAYLFTSEETASPDSLVEAMAVGLPTFAFPHSRCTCLKAEPIVRFSDAKDAAERILSVLSSRARWISVSRASRRHSLAHHDQRTVHAKYLGIYEKVAPRPQ